MKKRKDSMRQAPRRKPIHMSDVYRRGSMKGGGEEGERGMEEGRRGMRESDRREGDEEKRL